MNNTSTVTVGNPLSVRRAEILEAIKNKTYAPGQLAELTEELAEIEAQLSREWTVEEILEREG